MVDFLHSLPCKKQPATQQDEVFHREVETEKRGHRIAHADEQARSTKGSETHGQCQKQPDYPSLVPERWIDASHDKGDDQNVVDAKHQLEPD